MKTCLLSERDNDEETVSCWIADAEVERHDADLFRIDNKMTTGTDLLSGNQENCGVHFLCWH